MVPTMSTIVSAAVLPLSVRFAPHDATPAGARAHAVRMTAVMAQRTPGVTDWSQLVGR